MNELRAFHGDPAIKQKYLARIEAHRIADEIVQGVGFEHNGKIRACAVGCTLDVYDHSRYPIELGLPEWLARLEDTIHENVPLARAKRWPGQFLAAIPVGVDVEPVKWHLTIARMRRLLPRLANNNEPYARKCEDAINGVIVMAVGFLKDGFNKSAAWSAAAAAWSAASAASAARSAASAAWSAWSEESAAWSAAESAAMSARSAWSAAWSEAESARSAWSAAWSEAESAARSTRSAAESAAWSAWSEAYEQEADTLLALLAEAK
jgi:hypothetical protein